MEILILAIIMAALGGLFVGRTFASEDLFHFTQIRIKNLFYDTCDEEEYHDRLEQDFYKDQNLGDGYKPDLVRWQSIALGKAGDLLTCPKCIAVHVSNLLWTWMYNLNDALNWDWSLSIPALLVSGLIIYFVNSLMSD